MMIFEYFLKFDMVVTIVSLLTIVMLLILKLSIPKALLWVFGISLMISIITLLLIQLHQSKNNK
ncbi:MAG TPA: hypothetical protein H9808_05785 [Candidatus Atopostipes pullistercoris]|uniref:Uncharacterized protein n=1 Tax=Candidatus Atopostipes pullistercoris TaxID=2838467 RepID=A0A9D2G2U6_9LACT|nr:hypothetical protein [Candidatus Atopostipes pullistercoris]